MKQGLPINQNQIPSQVLISLEKILTLKSSLQYVTDTVRKHNFSPFSINLNMIGNIDVKKLAE